MDYDFEIGKNPCPECRKNHRDEKGENFYWYGEDEGGYCFSSQCGFTVPSKEYIENGYVNNGSRKGVTVSNKDLEKLAEKRLKEDELAEIYRNTVVRPPKGYRGLDYSVCEELGIRWEVKDGSVHKMYYPALIVEDGTYKTTGFKVREYPKKFYSVGSVGKCNTLAGQTHAVTDTLVILGGEVDLVSAKQMFKRIEKKYNRQVNVVSSLLGEDSTADCLKANIDWVEKHKKIILALDNDDAGAKATQKCIDILPKDKLFTANLRYKDANEYIKNGDEDSFLQDAYWNPSAVETHGLIGSRSLISKALEIVNQERIPLPPFLSGLDEVFRGGIGLQEIVNIVSSVSTGKSVFVNEIVLHWIMESKYKMLIVSLEDNAGSYGAKIASRIIGEKIMALRTPEERSKALIDNQEEINKFLVNEDGEDRFVLMEDASSDLESMKKSILYAIRIHNCKVILIDPIASLISSKPLDEQIDWMNFEEETRRIHGVTFINVAHTRKSTSGEKAHSEGGLISEEEIKGSSAISQTATVNLILRRNKLAEDEIERNTTYVDITKNRTVGTTGRNLAKIYYSNEHHMLFDFDYAESNNFFKGMTSSDILSKVDFNKSAPITSSLSDVEEVVYDELPDW